MEASKIKLKLADKPITILLLIIAVFLLYPIYWTFAGSFMTDAEIMIIPPLLFPRRINFDNYIELFRAAPTLRWFFNSVFVSAVTCFSVVLISSMAGYAFAKKKFPARDILFFSMVLGIMIPKQILVVPLFKIVNDLNMINKLSGLIIPALGFPFGVFLMKQFLVTLPSEIIESSTIDGCTEIGIYTKIILPIAKPGLGALAIFTFMNSWNDYMWQLLVISSIKLKTLPLGISTFHEQFSMRYGLLLAGGVLASLPMIAVFLMFQKYFTRGIVMGAVKG